MSSFGKRPVVISSKKERAILTHIHFTKPEWQEDLSEFKALVLSAGLEPIAVITGRRSEPSPKYFVGKGKAEEIAASATALSPNVILINHNLTPSQERNLGQLTNCRIVDRTRLILDIFAQRARSFEGQLQVELAQLEYLASRLVRGWLHLERQRGGIGLRGPGETQLETDRRLIRKRIQTIEKRLKKVRNRRTIARHARKRSDIPIISLVGYTNAGKSTLFNALTKATLYTSPQLFATLDPTLRRLHLQEVGDVILADTVGFIRHLPPTLIAAFHATLEETQEADLLLHVIDLSDPFYLEKKEAVENVLRQIGADHIPSLAVYNKIDQLPNTPSRMDRNSENIPQVVRVSATTGQGLDLLKQAIAECSMIF
jgi:GTP-binding protein HflX